MLNFSRKADLRRKIGAAGENAVCDMLRADGMDILARNWRCQAGELDIVALDKNEIVFVEVKSMRAKPGFTPSVNLSPRQRRRNYHAARVFIKMLNITGIPARFDLAEVVFRGRFITSIITHRDYLPQLPPFEE